MAQTLVTGPSPLELGEPKVERNWGCSLIATPHQLQHKGEDVDDVGVDLQGASDVVLWADGVLPVPQDQLGVVSQELQGQARVRSPGTMPELVSGQQICTRNLCAMQCA